MRLAHEMCADIHGQCSYCHGLLNRGTCHKCGFVHRAYKSDALESVLSSDELDVVRGAQGGVVFDPNDGPHGSVKELQDRDTRQRIRRKERAIQQANEKYNDALAQTTTRKSEDGGASSTPAFSASEIADLQKDEYKYIGSTILPALKKLGRALESTPYRKEVEALIKELEQHGTY